MAITIEMKRGDTRTIVIGLSRSDGSVVDLSGATGRFLMRPSTLETPVVNADAALDNTAKTATYELTADEAGDFLAEIEVLKAGRRETFPATGYIMIAVWPDLGDAP